MATWILERKFKDVVLRSDNPKVTANLRIRIDKPQMTAGRNVYCDIVSNSLKVSRKHATFILKPDDAFYVMDNWSSNGIFVNGKLIPAGTPFLLQVDDEVGLGVYSEMNITTSFINPVIDFKNIYIVKQEVDTKEGIDIIHNGTDDMEIVELSTTQQLQAMLTDDGDNNHNNDNNKKAELRYDNNYDDIRYSTQELCNILAFDDKHEGNLNGGANKNAMDCESKNYKSAEGVCYSEEDGVIVIDTDEVPCSQLLEIKEESFDEIKQESIDLDDCDQYDEEPFDEIKLENIHLDDSDECYHDEKLQDNSCNTNIDVNTIKNEVEITHNQQKKDNNDIINFVDEDDDCVISTLNTTETVNTINNETVILHNQQNKNNNVQAVTLSESINDIIKQKKLYCNGKDDNLQKKEEVEKNLLPETLERISDKLRNPILRQIKITSPHTEVKKIKNDFKIPSQPAKKSAIKRDNSGGIAENKSEKSSTIIEDINTKDGNSRGERKMHAKKCICEDKHMDTRKNKRSSSKKTTKSKGQNYKKSTVKDIDTVKRQETKKRKLKEIADVEKKKIKIAEPHINAPVKVKVSNNTRGQFLMEVANQNVLTENKKLIVEDASTKNINVSIVDKNQVISNEERKESKEDAKQNILVEEAVLVSDTSKNVLLDVADQTLTKKETVSLPIKRRIAHIENKNTDNQNSSYNSSTSSLLDSAQLTLSQFRISKLPAPNIVNDAPIVPKDRNSNMQTFINKKLYDSTNGTVEETNIVSDKRKPVLLEVADQTLTKKETVSLPIKGHIAHIENKNTVNQNNSCNSSTSSLLESASLTLPQLRIPKLPAPNIINDAPIVPKDRNPNIQTFINKKLYIPIDGTVEETNIVSDKRKHVLLEVADQTLTKKETVSLPIKRRIAHIENKNTDNDNNSCNSSTASLLESAPLTLAQFRIPKQPAPNIINDAPIVSKDRNPNIQTFINKKLYNPIDGTVEETNIVSDKRKHVLLEVADQTLTKKETVSLPIKRRIAHIKNKNTVNQNSSCNSSTSSLLESAPSTLPQFRIPKLPAPNIINDAPIVPKDRNPIIQTFINKKLYIPIDGTVEETSIVSDTRKQVLVEGTSQAATKKRIAHTGIKSIVNQHSNCNSSTSGLLKTPFLTWPQLFLPKPPLPNADASNVPAEKNRNMQTFLNKKPNVLTDRQNSLMEERNPVSDARKNVSVQSTNEVSTRKEAVSLPAKRRIAHIENKNIVNQHSDCNSSISSLFKPSLLTLPQSRIVKLQLPNIINGASNVPTESNATIPTFINKKLHVPINNFNEDLILSMLSWKTRWFEIFRDSNILPETLSNRLINMPLFFNTFHEYYETLKGYLELELFHSIYKTLNCSNPRQQTFQAQINNEIKKRTYVELQCSTYLNQEQSSYSNVLKQNFVVLIQFAIKQNEKTITIPLLGFVTDVTLNKLHNNTIIDENFLKQIQVKPFAKLLFTVMVENYKGYAVKSMKIFIRSMTIITTFIRYMDSVKQLKQSPLCQHILKPSIDLYATSQYQNNIIPLDTSLNLSQFQAVSEAIQMYLHKKHGLYLIQGPPGTGKTKVILKIIQQLLMRRHQDSRQPCILVTAPSNIAVDEIAMELIKLKSNSDCELGHKGIRLVRVGVRPMINITVQDYYIFDLVRKNIVSNLLRYDLSNDDKDYISSLYKAIKQAKVEYFSLNGKSKLQAAEQQFDYGVRKYFKENYNFIFKRKQQELLDKADVICSTLSSSLGSGLSSVFYRGLHNRKLTLIIDEASRSCEPETLIPLSLNIDKVILAGDPKQLPAVTLCQGSKDLGHGSSVFERLSQNFDLIGCCSIKMLNVQYRMHPEIARFPNETFYDGKLRNATSVETRKNKLQMLKPYMVFNLKTNMHCSQEYSNKTEATCVINLLEAIALNLNCSETFSVGVITPYNDQKVMIRTRLSDKKLEEKFQITVNTVDSFQGLEKDIIILSFVREYGNTFVSDEQRINVALTRAKYVLYIIGSEDIYESCKTLNAIYQDALIRNAHKVITHETQNRQLAKLIRL